jgi:hypothetical protein
VADMLLVKNGAKYVLSLSNGKVFLSLLWIQTSDKTKVPEV